MTRHTAVFYAVLALVIVLAVAYVHAANYLIDWTVPQ